MSKLSNARASARRERDNSKTLAWIGAGAPIAAVLTAETVLPMLPGPSAKEFTDMVARKAPWTENKRVLVGAGLTAALVFFGGKSIYWRGAAALAGGYTAAAIEAHNQLTGQADLAKLAYDPEA